MLSGKADLANVSLREDIFTKMGFPLELIYGKIGHLAIQVPYRSLGSEPVKAKLSDLQIVVKPQTDQSKWDLTSLFKDKDTSGVEQAINEYVWTKYIEYRVSNFESCNQLC